MGHTGLSLSSLRPSLGCWLLLLVQPRSLPSSSSVAFPGLSTPAIAQLSGCSPDTDTLAPVLPTTGRFLQEQPLLYVISFVLRKVYSQKNPTYNLTYSFSYETGFPMVGMLSCLLPESSPLCMRFKIIHNMCLNSLLKSKVLGCLPGSVRRACES